MERTPRDSHQGGRARPIARSDSQRLLEELFLVLLTVEDVAAGSGQGGNCDGRSGGLGEARI